MFETFFDNYIGEKYREFNEDGTYLGCIRPFYLLFPDAPKFPFDKEKHNNKIEMLCRLKTCTIEIRREDELKFGDVIFCKSMGSFHLMIFISGNKAVHVQKDSTMQYIKFDINDRRIIGFYRWYF